MPEELKVRYRSSWLALAETLAVRHVFGLSLGHREFSEALAFDECQGVLEWLEIDRREITASGDLEADYNEAFKNCPEVVARFKMPAEPTVDRGVEESAAQLVAKLVG